MKMARFQIEILQIAFDLMEIFRALSISQEEESALLRQKKQENFGMMFLLQSKSSNLSYTVDALESASIEADARNIQRVADGGMGSVKSIRIVIYWIFMKDMKPIIKIEVIKMIKPLFLFCGKSASGKTTIANMLADLHGYVQIESYTTRKPRFDDEPGHIFVSEEEFNNLGELAAYTYYNGNHYGTTFEQIEGSDIYVVDVPGIETLLQKLVDDTRPICILYFQTSVYNRILRMIDRGDNDTMIVSRLLQDEKDDWLKQLDSLAWKYTYICDMDIQLHSINANGNLENVLDLVLYYMNRYKED